MRMKPALVLAFALATASSAHARAQNAAQVSSFTNTRASSFVVFGPTVECADGTIGSAFGFGFLEGSDSISHTPGSPKSSSNGGDILIFDYSDSCGNFIGFGEGFFQGGFTPPNAALTSAAMNFSGFVQDFDTGNSYPMTVNLVYTADGPLSSDHGATVERDFQGATVIVTHGASSNRDAGVTGTITINGATPEASYSANVILSNSSGTTTVIQK